MFLNADTVHVKPTNIETSTFVSLMLKSVYLIHLSQITFVLSDRICLYFSHILT